MTYPLALKETEDKVEDECLGCLGHAHDDAGLAYCILDSVCEAKDALVV